MKLSQKNPNEPVAKIILIISFGLLVFVAIPLSLLYKKSFEKKLYERFVEFDSSLINGRFSSIEGSGGRYYFELSQDSIEYVFLPYYNLKENSYYSFHDVQVGDSVYKDIYSDTLYVIKNSRKYPFTVKEYP